MMTLDEKFSALETNNAPGQELRQNAADLDAMMRGGKLTGIPVDFSHGDVDAFPPTPGALEAWNAGFERGGRQAYTEYRGAAQIREGLADRLGAFTGRPVSAESELILTPGTQGALFLALGATVDSGTKVAVVEPNYFANRKLVTFFGGEIVPIPLDYQGLPLDYQGLPSENGLDLDRLEAAFNSGTKVCVFSTPNNPTGLVYSSSAIATISALAAAHGVH